MLRFLIFVNFLLIFLITCRISSKIGKFGKKLNFLPYLTWNSKNLKKFAKMRKRNIKLDVFKSKKQFKINFSNFCQFLVHFEQKVAKNMFFVIFSKTVSFGQNLTLPMCSL